MRIDLQGVPCKSYKVLVFGESLENVVAAACHTDMAVFPAWCGGSNSDDAPVTPEVLSNY